ncbi:hypothetical protein B0H13DRAFT_796176 [Mycena leptocephala]|nr:hypothetical protein B0H13DRAFT_796176 [Mycena leptocephala]
MKICCSLLLSVFSSLLFPAAGLRLYLLLQLSSENGHPGPGSTRLNFPLLRCGMQCSAQNEIENHLEPACEFFTRAWLARL